MHAVLRISSTGEILAANDAALDLLGRCEGGRCCDAVLARGDQQRVLCNPSCSARLISTRTPDETDRRVQIRGRLCRIVCTKVGAEGVVIIEVGPTVPSTSRLTEREREALSLVAEGLSTDDLAQRLGVSASTARTHVERAREKLGVRSRAAAVATAIRRGEI